MATYYLSINRGQVNEQQVVVGTTVPSSDFYFFWTDTHNPTELDCVLAMRAITRYMESNGVAVGKIGVDIPKL